MKNEIDRIKSVLNDKNLSHLKLSDGEVFNLVSVNEETFTLKDSNDDLYNFWIESVVDGDGILCAVCHDSDAEYEFDMFFHDESILHVVE